MGQTGLRAPLALLLFALAGAGAVVAAEDADPAGALDATKPVPRPTASATIPPPNPSNGGVPDAVGLDQLLKLPDSFERAPAPKQAGPDEETWRRRFSDSRAELQSAERGLEQAMEKLEDSAGGGYAMAPPGANLDAEESPGNFGGRAAVRRQRETLEQVQRNHRALVVEADLAGVPIEWREPAKPAPEPDLGE